MNNFAFFGTSKFSVIILGDLKNKYNIVPSLLVTQPDKPVGRKQIITPPEAKIWAQENNVKVFQPEKLKNEEVKNVLRQFDFFVVASYGKIIPSEILKIPQKGAVNVHPSLLPKYRGASPIQSQIINGDKKMGTSIILMDEEMDHGPIIAQREVDVPHNGYYDEIEAALAHGSAELLGEVLPKWIEGEIKPEMQEHAKATFTKIITKEDGEINLSDDAEKNYRKYLAYHHWPRVFYFKENPPSHKALAGKERIIITEAKLEDEKFKIVKIIPEGKKETFFNDFS